VAEAQPTESLDPPTSPDFGSVVARLTSVNVLLLAAAFVTSPVLARALGPDGRGEVAAIFAVVSLAPWISDLGIASYLSRERARGVLGIGTLLGSTMPVTLGASLIGMLAAVPVAHLLGRGRSDVIFFIEIGLFQLPLLVFTLSLYGILVGEQRWNVVILSRLLSTVGAAVGIVALGIAGDLTVASAAITYIVAGLVAQVPLLVGLKRSFPWHFQRDVAWESAAFGARSWLSTLASTGNLRLDMVLMAGLVSSRQLGLYSIAATIAYASGSLVQAVANALTPRVAAGDGALVARAARVATLMVASASAALAAVSPILVPIVFGVGFTDSVPMLVVLLAASVLLVPGQVLNAAVIAGGDPGPAARSQILGLVITIPGLIVLLPLIGGIAAAWVSLFSYAVSLAVILRAAARLFSMPIRDFLAPTRADIRWLFARFTRLRHRPHLAKTTQ